MVDSFCRRFGRHFVRSVYRRLHDAYGTQGWWPIADAATGESTYHAGAPRGEEDFFEIAVGAILTQNVAWINVAPSIAALKREGLLHPTAVIDVPHDRLAALVRSSGYYNQKADKIRHFAAWYERYGGYGAVKAAKTDRLRRELLAIRGIGPETADSILLYGLRRRVFVVDAYTVRIFTRLGALSGRESYHEIQGLFHRALGGSTAVYAEYHALIVAHGKRHCRTKPICEGCPLRRMCRFPLSLRRTDTR